MIVGICIGAMIGMIVGRFFRDPENDCPSIELGYRCKGDLCDHRESTLLRVKLDMALQQEQVGKKNYWGGPDA